SNGVHQIYWTAADYAGNIDGIGSRYFTVNNPKTTTRALRVAKAAPCSIKQIDTIPVDLFTDIIVSKGYGKNGKYVISAGKNGKYVISAGKNGRVVPFEKNGMTVISHEKNGVFKLELKELERVVLDLDTTGDSCKVSGFMKVGDKLKSLPIGSTLDTKSGVFYWQPGHGFIGKYSFVFILENTKGDRLKKNIEIEIR
ncbi:MAG: hypothetical protein GY757_47205, partial [bacterium]|nr:hypothetical protein [bacterium]